MKITKKTLVFVLASFLVVSVFGAFAIANDPESGIAAFTCTAPGGSCTAGELICKEDQGTIHACEFKCQADGTWGGPNECDTNMCYGAKCDQGSIYSERELFGDNTRLCVGGICDERVSLIEKLLLKTRS